MVDILIDRQDIVYKSGNRVLDNLIQGGFEYIIDVSRTGFLGVFFWLQCDNINVTLMYGLTSESYT